MPAHSRSGWSAAIGAFSDTVRAFNLFPMGYLALFFLCAIQQFFFVPLGRKPQADFTMADASLVFILVIVLSLIILAFLISPFRYFAGGDIHHPYGFGRPYLRLLGWALMLCIPAAILIVAVAIASFFIAETSRIAAFALFAVSSLVFFWIGLRLTTLWPAIALDEPAPVLGRSFRETRGFVWFFIRTILFSLIIFIPVGLLSALVQYVVFGPEIFSDAVPGEPPLPLSGRIADAVFGGIAGLFSLMYPQALIARMFRVVRDFV